MSRLRDSVLLACLLIGFPGAFAEEPSTAEKPPISTPTEPVFAVVMGLSADDLLNIRREASPLGRTLGRLPNGALVNRGVCKTVEGYEWCRVETVEGDALGGWAPSRYLFVQASDDSQTGATASAEPTAPEPETEEIAGENTSATASRIPLPQPAPRVGTDIAGTAAPEDALPAGLEARFASGDARPIAEIQRPEQDRLALATEAVDQIPETAAAVPDSGAEPESPGMPVPTPRPIQVGEAATIPAQPPAAAPPKGHSFALAEVPDDPEVVPDREPHSGPVGSIGPADGSAKADRIETFASVITERQRPQGIGLEIPCARYIGQPMTRCSIRVARGGRNTADVTIAWPDGGNRTIAFRDGLPASANTRGDLRVEREGTLSMIRIGAGERFEILDALVFDD